MHPTKTIQKSVLTQQHLRVCCIPRLMHILQQIEGFYCSRCWIGKSVQINWALIPESEDDSVRGYPVRQVKATFIIRFSLMQGTYLRHRDIKPAMGGWRHITSSCPSVSSEFSDSMDLIAAWDYNYKELIRIFTLLWESAPITRLLPPVNGYASATSLRAALALAVNTTV